MIVVDASVVVHWLIPGAHSRAASLLLDGEQRLLAPDLVVAEVGNTVWKLHRQRLLSRDEARAAVDSLALTPIVLRPAAELIASGECVHGVTAFMSRTEPTFPDP